MNRTFKIPCSWQVYSTMYINASSLEEAIALAEDDERPLPTDASYIDGSFEVDGELAEFFADETVMEVKP